MKYRLAVGGLALAAVLTAVVVVVVVRADTPALVVPPAGSAGTLDHHASDVATDLPTGPVVGNGGEPRHVSGTLLEQYAPDEVLSFTGAVIYNSGDAPATDLRWGLVEVDGLEVVGVKLVSDSGVYPWIGVPGFLPRDTGEPVPGEAPRSRPPGPLVVIDVRPDQVLPPATRLDHEPGTGLYLVAIGYRLPVNRAKGYFRGLRLTYRVDGQPYELVMDDSARICRTKAVCASDPKIPGTEPPS